MMKFCQRFIKHVDWSDATQWTGKAWSVTNPKYTHTENHSKCVFIPSKCGHGR